MTQAKYEKMLLRVSPEARTALEELTRKFKHISTRQWSMSRLVNILILEHCVRYDAMPPEKVNKLFNDYVID